MITSYVFDPALNINNFFKNTPPAAIEIDRLPKLPQDWLTQLETQCQKAVSGLAKNIFSQHLNNAKYSGKNTLYRQLSLIYYRFSGALDSQLGHLDDESIKILVLELTEEIEQCTLGFHIRVNKIVLSFHTPYGLDQLLYLVRKSIIQEIAARLANKVNPIYQIHVADRAFRIAKKKGLAVEPNIQLDPYKSLLPGKTIRKFLAKEFPKHYTALKIPFLLAEQLRLILSLHYYNGPKETGYTTGVAENILFVIERFLPNPAQERLNKLTSFFIIDNPVDEFSPRIYDINWPSIQEHFFKKLSESYFDQTNLHILNLFDYAYYQALSPNKTSSKMETKLIETYLINQTYIELINQLTSIQDKFPCFWIKLIKNPSLAGSIDDLLNFLHAKQNSSPEFIKKVDLVYKLLFYQDNAFILSKIIAGHDPKKISHLSITAINHDLLLKSVRYHPEFTQSFFANLKNNCSPKIFKELLLKQNIEGSNLLMLAGRYHAQTVKIILSLITQHIDLWKMEEVSQLFLSQNKDNWNFLSLSAMHRPEALNIIFEFFKQYPKIFNVEILKKIFYQKNRYGWNFFYLLARFQSKAQADICLDFISKKFKSSSNRQWLDIFLQKYHTGNLLKLAAQSNLTALQSILNFMSKHIDQIERDVLNDFFSPSHSNHWHSLHSAARYSPNNLGLILQFIEKHIGQFDIHYLRKLFLAQNFKAKHNFLMLAAYHYPDSIQLIFKFIHRQDQVFDKETLKELFLQKNSDGWNFLSASLRYPHSLKIILGFITDHMDKFDPETIKQIILQKNKHAYTCLHLATCFQPASLEIILSFINNQPINLFKNELPLLFPHKKERNLLQLSLTHQPQTVLSVIEVLLGIYLNKYRHVEENPTQHWLFFSKRKYSVQEKRTATEAFKHLLQNNKNLSVQSIKNLKAEYPAVDNGELGKVYQQLALLPTSSHAK